MKVKLLNKARKIWQTMLEKKLNPVKEAKRLQVSIGLYEEFLRSLPESTIDEIRQRMND